jgi:hypothetical protein
MTQAIMMASVAGLVEAQVAVTTRNTFPTNSVVPLNSRKMTPSIAI